MSNNELKPCPFCGGELRLDVIVHIGRKWFGTTRCPKCQYELHVFNKNSRIEAQRALCDFINNRPSEAMLEVRIAKLEAALREIVDPVYLETNGRRCTCQDGFKEIANKALEDKG